MGYTFESKFFGEKPMKRLLDAANDHAFNIRPLSRGEHVEKIHAALFAIEDAKIKPNELGQGLYGDSTANAVAEFKRKRDIFNHLNRIDNIVGIKTMRALDQEMKKRDGGIGPAPAVRTQDILIHILGQDPTSGAAGKKTSDGQPFIGVPPTDQFNKEVQTADYLKKHEPLIHQQWNGGLPQFSTDPTKEVVEFIKSTVGGIPSEKLGRMILIGMSSGGRNVATVAHELKDRPRLFAYVAAIDAAFNNRSDPAINSGVSAVRSENFFQTIGNDILPGNEFHSAIPSFQQNVRLDQFPSLQQIAEFLRGPNLDRVKQGLVNKAHEFAVRHGYATAKQTALAILKA